jgi:uncharacterized membrane protein YbaN (DUF454 family)
MDQQPPTPYRGEMQRVARGPLRWVLLGLGWLFVALGVAGAVVPVLPTTPFILLAAACFARSSERFYAWLLDNRIFGPLIRDWRAHRAIPRRARWLGIGAIVLFLGSSVVFFVANPWLRGFLLLTGAALIGFLYRLPNREDVV